MKFKFYRKNTSIVLAEPESLEKSPDRSPAKVYTSLRPSTPSTSLTPRTQDSPAETLLQIDEVLRLWTEAETSHLILLPQPPLVRQELE